MYLDSGGQVSPKRPNSIMSLTTVTYISNKTVPVKKQSQLHDLSKSLFLEAYQSTKYEKFYKVLELYINVKIFRIYCIL
jgi:hypothetical protein